MNSYQVPDLAPGEIHQAEETIKRSRFIVSIARVRTVDEAKHFIDGIRMRYSDATHNCWAFSAGSPGSTAKVGASDDGEPKGTAGRPMVTVLEHCGVGEIAAVVTRYFGGTLLGTGGLVHAYQGLVKLGLQSLPTCEMVPTTCIDVEIEHRFYNHLARLIEDAAGRVLKKEFSSNVILSVEVADSACANLIARIGTVTAGRALVKVRDTVDEE